MFLNFVQGRKADVSNNARDVESFYRQAKRDEKRKTETEAMRGQQNFGQKNQRKRPLEPSLLSLIG